MATHVTHDQHPEYGRGEVLDVYAGQPPIYRIRWSVFARNGRRLWGDYPAPEIVLHSDAPIALEVS